MILSDYETVAKVHGGRVGGHDSGIGKMVKLNMITSHSPFNIFLISGSKLMNAGDQLS